MTKDINNHNYKLNICALLDVHFEDNMQIYPTYEILNYLTNFGHRIVWFIIGKKIKNFYDIKYNENIPVYVIPYSHNLIFTYRKMKFILKKFDEEKYNITFVRNGIFDGLLAIYIRKLYDVPFVFQIDSPIEQNIERRLFYSKHKRISKILSKIELFLIMQILHKADLVLPISNWLLEDFCRKGINRSKMIIFPDGINENRFRFKSMEDLRRKYMLENFNIIIYLGTMDRLRYLHVLIHAISKVMSRNQNVKLLMVGDGNDRHSLEELVEELRIKQNVIFTGHISFNEVPTFISAADIGVCPIPPLDFYKLSSPIKLIEYMAMKKAVVANYEIPEHKRVINESNGGILVKFDSESISKGIIKLLNNPDMMNELGNRGYEWVKKNRSYDLIAKRLEKGLFYMKNKKSNISYK